MPSATSWPSPKATRIGGDIALVHGEGLAGQITEALGGAELQLVIDGEGGSTVSALAASLRHDGTVVAFSSITAQPQQIQFGDLLFRNVQLRGFYTVNWIHAVSRERLEHVYAGRPGRTGKILLRAGT